MAQKDPGKPHKHEGLFLSVEFFGHFLGSLLVMKQVLGLTHFQGKDVLCNLLYFKATEKKCPKEFENKHKACLEVKEEAHQFNR